MKTSSLYSFDKNGNFTDRDSFFPESKTLGMDETADGGTLLLTEESGNGFSTVVVKSDADGTEKWRAHLNGFQYYGDGSSSCCSSSSPVASVKLNSGGNLILATRDDNVENGYQKKLVLLQVDDNGYWK
jgi:hypothetical protein